MKLKNAQYKFRVENTQLQIPNLRYIGFFSQSKDCKTLKFLHTNKIKSAEVNLTFYLLEISENHRFLMLSRGIKGNIDPKWVKRL